MRVGFVSTAQFRADSVASWSGLPYHISQSLERAGLEVVPLHVPVGQKWRTTFVNLACERFDRYVHQRRFLPDRTPAVLCALGRRVMALAHAAGVDAIFAPSSLPLADLPPGLPAYFWTDAIFSGMLGFYRSFSDLSPRSVQHGREADQRALQRAAMAFFASEWAGQSARDLHSGDPEKIVVVPFGANLDPPPEDSAVAAAIQARQPDRPRLLFLGVDWERKGGDVALAVVQAARDRGIAAELHLAGTTPPPGSLPDVPWVVAHGFIAKDSTAGRNHLHHLLRTSEWMILPSRAECFGLVFAEAAAFGVPSLAYNVGGVASAVGANGHLFSPADPPAAWVDFLAVHSRDPQRYRTLATRARQEFLLRLNWEVAGKTVAAHLQAARPTALTRY